MTVKLRSLDLNLLVPLEALLAERSVTRAAERLGLSQPSLSAALRRLRRHFGDELLTRVGNRYELTPLAAQLRPLTDQALVGAGRVFGSFSLFDPAVSEREFTLVASDHGMAVFGAALAGEIARTAPDVSLRFLPLTAEVLDRTDDSLRMVDGLLTPHGLVHGFPHMEVLTDDWVCVVSKDNPHVGAELTMRHLAELPWVVTSSTSSGSKTAVSMAVRQLRLLGLRPRMRVAAESFLTVPLLVAGSDRVALMQRRALSWVAEGAGLRILPCPFDALPLKLALWWHPVHEPDAGHRWLRERVAAAAAGVQDTPGAQDTG